MISSGASDEVFVSVQFSMKIRIAELIERIREGSVVPSMSVLPINAADMLIRSDTINEQHATDMSESRRDEPLIVMSLGNAKLLIDGNHRLVRRIRDGFCEIKVIEFCVDDVSDFIEPFSLYD